VKNIIFNDNQTQIDISQLSQGMYLMKIVSDKGIAVKKIVKE
jgi:hypothetical protein